MNRIKYLLVVLVMASSVFYYSCDDSGVIPKDGQAGIVVFKQLVSLKTLEPVDGMYNMWVLIADTLGNQRFLNLGRFNVLSNGSLVNENGTPVNLAIDPADTVDLARVINCRVTIEQTAAAFPGPTVILGGAFTVTPDSVVAQLTFNDPLALGVVGDSLLGTGVGRYYIINTPSNSGVDCQKGIWYTDLNGVSTLPDVQLNPGGGWQFRGWVRNRLTNENFTTGAFFNPQAEDLDGAGPCKGSEQGYNAPGQDWILSGCSNIDHLFNGNYEVFIVLEPKDRDPVLPPFNLKVYWQSIISPTLGCIRQDNLFSQRGSLPKASLNISR